MTYAELDRDGVGVGVRLGDYSRYMSEDILF